MKKTLYLFVLMALIFGFVQAANAKIPGHILTSGQNSIAPMLKDVMPAVVNVISLGEIPPPTSPFLKRELQRLEKEHKNQLPKDKHFAGVGSGVIIDAKKGFIVTNAHVVDMSKKIIVTLNDGRRYPAKKIGVDNSSDIALLAIQGKNLKSIPFGNSEDLKVGDFVAAVGSPFGLNQTVTSGIVSALHRTNLGLEGVENFIQTDAPINIGNSGGALVNLQGQLVGINTAILTNGGGNLGIGFAIPSDMVHSIVTQILKYGKVRHGLLGVLVQTLSPDLVEALHLSAKQKGAIVTHVLPYSAADEAGLKVGDIITKLNSKKVTSAGIVRDHVGLLRIGTPLHLAILRNGKPLIITATTKNAKEAAKKQQTEDPYLHGMTLKEVAKLMPNQGYIRGIEVIKLNPYSPAMTAGLHEGDIIVSANQQSITSINALITAAKKAKTGLLLNVIQKGGSVFLVIK